MSGVKLAAALALWAAVAVPASRAALESRLLTHMLVQLPALAISGYVLGMVCRDCLSPFLADWNRGGATGLALSLPAIAFWMLPRSIDAAVDSMTFEFVKFSTVPLLIGLPLALSVQQFGSITSGFLKANFISMSLFLGWLYIAAPVRLCNSYLIDDQIWLGRCWLAIACLTAVLWSAPLCVSAGRERRHREPKVPSRGNANVLHQHA